MQVGTLFRSALLAAGLLTGCGGAAPGAEEQVPLASQEEELPDCSRQDYETEY